jgi:predicted glycoside hydrolase/deacetylase ChbG (UPF0249 family)
MNERFLIVNADDYGLTHSVNAAVEELFSLGAITSSTVLAPASLAKEACSGAARNGYPVGVHWTLHSEWAEEPWAQLAGEGAASLSKDGFLRSDAMETARLSKPKDVTRELIAQIEFMKKSGRMPDHADSHGGTLYGANGRLFFLNAFRVCRQYRLPFRFPKRLDFIARQTGGSPNRILRTAHRVITLAAAFYGVELLDDLITNPYPAEKIASYDALRAYYEEQLQDSKAGITEVFLHPSKPDEALQKRTPQWQKRLWEYRYLSGGDFIRFIEKEGFKLASWDILAKRMQ